MSQQQSIDPNMNDQDDQNHDENNTQEQTHHQDQQHQPQIRGRQQASHQWNKSNMNQSQKILQNSQSQYFLPNIHMDKRKVWNPRFHVSSLNNLAGSHPFYRSYFDKNEKVNDQRLLKPYHPDKSMKEIIQKHQTQMLRRSTSQTGIQNWDNYFSKMNSKNNEKVHTNFREFFDKPIQYDPRGYNGNMPFAPMEVYGRLSPKGKQLQRVTSQDFYKSKPAERFLHTNKSVAQLKVNEILQLRGSNVVQEQKSPKIKKMENKWNERIGLPISTFNEGVFPRYKITFDHL